MDIIYYLALALPIVVVFGPTGFFQEISDFLFGTEDRARTDNLRNVKEAIKAIQGFSPRQRTLLDLAQFWQERGPDIVGEGYERARKQAHRTGQSYKRGATDRAKRLTGSIESDAITRGIGSTNVVANLRRGVASDTERRIQEIDDRLAQVLSGIEERATGAQYRAISDLSQFFFNRSQAESQLPLAEASFRSGIQFVGSPGYIQSVASGAGQAAGAAIAACDRRLKRVHRKVDEAEGVALYEFNYLDAPETVLVGPMADEVEAVFPEAVLRVPSAEGFLALDLGKLPASLHPRPLEVEEAV